MEENHYPVNIEASHGRADDAEEDHGPNEASQERTGNVDEKHGPVIIEAACERPDDAEEDHCLVSFEATNERTDTVEENHSLVGIEAAHERTDNVTEDHVQKRWRYLSKNWLIYIVEDCSIHSANTSHFSDLYLQKHIFF